jgi:ribokinase
VLDPTPARPLPIALLAAADYLTPNESELCLLTGSPGAELTLAEAEQRARQLLGLGANKVLVKLAERGALLVGAEGARAFAPLSVQAVDTTAAGDAFNAGLAYGLARGLDEVQAIELAMAAGAFAVTARGAQPSMPSLSDVEPLLVFGIAALLFATPLRLLWADSGRAWYLPFACWLVVNLLIFWAARRSRRHEA